MRSITAAVTLALMAADWWDRTYNHAAYARGLEGLLAAIKHSFWS